MGEARRLFDQLLPLFAHVVVNDGPLAKHVEGVTRMFSR